MFDEQSETKIKINQSQEVGSTTNTHRILLAEDNDEMRSQLAEVLKGQGYEVIECRNGGELLKHLSPIILDPTAATINLIISDIRTPSATGLQVLEYIDKREGIPPIILITGFGDDHTHAQARQFRASAIFDKPFEIEDLPVKVREVLSSKS